MKAGFWDIVINPWSVCLPVASLFFGLSATAETEWKDGTKAAKINAIGHDGTPLQLPLPPPEIFNRLVEGHVRFEFFDPKAARREFSGETKFEFRYTYKTQSRWHFTQQQGKPALKISITYQDVELHRSHRILLPADLIGADWFNRTLTQHEFDHLAISSDSRLPALLASMLNERNAAIVELLDEGTHGFNGTPSREELSRINKQVVATSSDQVFDDFVNLVSIRYRELDRVTRHGLLPLLSADRKRLIDRPLEMSRGNGSPAPRSE